MYIKIKETYYNLIYKLDLINKCLNEILNNEKLTDKSKKSLKFICNQLSCYYKDYEIIRKEAAQELEREQKLRQQWIERLKNKSLFYEKEAYNLLNNSWQLINEAINSLNYLSNGSSVYKEVTDKLEKANEQISKTQQKLQ